MGWQALPVARWAISEDGRGREALPECQERSRVPPGGPGLVVRTSRRTRRDLEALPEGLEGSVGPSRGPGGSAAPPEGRKGSGSLRGLRGVGKVQEGIWRAERGQEALLKGREGWGGPP